MNKGKAFIWYLKGFKDSAEGWNGECMPKLKQLKDTFEENWKKHETHN